MGAAEALRGKAGAPSSQEALGVADGGGPPFGATEQPTQGSLTLSLCSNSCSQPED